MSVEGWLCCIYSWFDLRCLLIIIFHLSRYPGEAEYLWVPCSFVQPRGEPVMDITPEGLVTM